MRRFFGQKKDDKIVEVKSKGYPLFSFSIDDLSHKVE